MSESLTPIQAEDYTKAVHRLQDVERVAKKLREVLEGVLLTETDRYRQSDDRWSVFRYSARTAIARAKELGL